MPFEIRDVFKKNVLRMVIIQNLTDIRKQITPVFLVIKALPFTRLAERLTWETCTKDVMWWYILWSYLCNISFYPSARKVYVIEFAQIFTQFRGKYTLMSQLT